MALGPLPQRREMRKARTEAEVGYRREEADGQRQQADDLLRARMRFQREALEAVSPVSALPCRAPCGAPRSRPVLRRRVRWRDRGVTRARFCGAQDAMDTAQRLALTQAQVLRQEKKRRSTIQAARARAKDTTAESIFATQRQVLQPNRVVSKFESTSDSWGSAGV